MHFNFAGVFEGIEIGKGDFVDGVWICASQLIFRMKLSVSCFLGMFLMLVIVLGMLVVMFVGVFSFLVTASV